MEGFWNWWQHLPQHISPVIFQIGSFKLQYYGLMYIVAFGFTYFLVLYRLRRNHRKHFRRGHGHEWCRHTRRECNRP